MKKLLLSVFVFVLLAEGCKKDYSLDTGNNSIYTVRLNFINFTNGSPVQFDTVSYMNDFGETFTVSKLRYYVSNIQFRNSRSGVYTTVPDSYFLIDESKSTSKTLSFSLDSGKFDQVVFLLGVDSIRNVSGAQTGALDPANDMFWTWNTGYIQFKLEGQSPASTLVNQKIEYHIGGFRSGQNTVRKVVLNLPSNRLLNIQSGRSGDVIIGAEIDRIFNDTHALDITTYPTCTSPGTLAVQYADNYEKMFFVVDVINN